MLWLSKRKKLIDTELFAGRLRDRSPSEMFERLEDRIVFWTGDMLGGMPTHAQMENPYHTVVRMLTNMGPIDVELFDLSAPQTVANFRNYIDQGRLDETIFHRSEPGVLGGGAFRFHNDTGASPVPTFAPVNNEFSRLNTERTIAMAKVPNNPNSATSQFYFNLTDNPHLDSQNGGHTVFGRVIQGWNIVQTIAGLQTQDLNQQLLGTSTGPLANVPVQQNFPSVGATESSLVRITDIELIKTWGSARSYTHSTVMPEGFRGANVVETIHLQNMDRDVFNFYQIIVRYENGQRDQVISRGLLQAGQQRFFKVSDFNFPNYNVVRANTPYSIEVRSTRAMAATLNHRDWGVSLEESFVNPMPVTRGELINWVLPSGEKGPGHQSYVTWTNLSSSEVRLNIHIRADDGTVVAFQRWVEPYRRGGINVGNLGLVPDGKFSVQIRATDPIVAGLSQYKTGAHGSQAHGSLAMGTLGPGGSTSGVLAGAVIPSQGEAFVDFVYPALGGQPAQLFIDLEWIYSDGSKDVTTHLIDTNQRNVRVNLGAQNPTAPRDEFFTLRYAVKFEAGSVAGTYISRLAGDEMRTNFQTVTTQNVGFAHGYTSPAMHLTGGMKETISVFNPYKPGALNIGFSYDLEFQFADGTKILAAATTPGTPNVFSLGAHQRADHIAYDFPAVKAKIDSGFHFYSVQVIGAPLSFPIVRGGVVAQLTRTMDSWFQTMTTLPSLDARLPVARLGDSLFV